MMEAIRQMTMEISDLDAVFCGQQVGAGVTAVCAKNQDDRRQLLGQMTLELGQKRE